MVTAIIKIIKNDGDVLLTTDIIKFKNIDDLIRYCTSKTTYKYTYDYELVSEEYLKESGLE